MAKSLTANVTTGRLAGSSTPVWLFLLTDGTNTFRWATKATSTFSAWTGTAHTAGMIPQNEDGTPQLPTIREEIDLPGGKHIGALGDMTLDVINAAYSGTTRFDEYLVANSITLEGMTLEMRLVFDAADASWANAVVQFKGDVSAVSFDLAVMRITVQGRTRDAFPMIPGAKAVSLSNPPAIIEDEAYSDWNYFGLGNTQVVGRVIPMVFGANVPSVPAYLTSAETGAQLVTVDTQTLFAGGTLSVEFDGDLWEVTPSLYSWGTAQRIAEFVSDAVTTDANRVAFLTERLVPGPWSGGFSITNPNNAMDGNAASYATAVLNDSLDKTDYKTFTGVGTQALKDRLQNLSLVSVFGYAKIESSSATNLDGGATYMDHIRLKGGPGAGWDTADDGQFGYTGSPAYNSYSGADDPARAQIVNSEVDPPPSVDSVLLAGIAFAPGDRAVPESITAKLYEFEFQLELALPFYSTAFWTVEPDGREYGGSSGFTGSGRYDSAASTALIESPAAIVEAILRQELGETTAIDTASFDAAHTALKAWAYTGMGSDAPNEWSAAGAATDLVNSLDCIGAVCRETGLAFLDRYDSTYGLAFIAPATAVKTIAHADGEIRSGTFKLIQYTHKRDIKNLFLIRYGFDIRTGQYTKVLRMGKDSGLVSGDPWYYLQLACSTSVTAYGVERELALQCKWIHEEAMAYKLLDWLVWRWTRLAKLVEFESAGLDDIDLELLDTVTVKHPLTDETDGEDYLVYRLVQNPERLTTTIAGMHIPELSRDNGDPL